MKRENENCVKNNKKKIEWRCERQTKKKKRVRKNKE